MKKCELCGADKKAAFSKEQWKKGGDAMKCKACTVKTGKSRKRENPPISTLETKSSLEPRKSSEAASRSYAISLDVCDEPIAKKGKRSKTSGRKKETLVIDVPAIVDNVKTATNAVSDQPRAPERPLMVERAAPQEHKTLTRRVKLPPGSMEGSFSPDVFSLILGYVDGPTLSAVSQVCREWHNAAHDDVLWMRICTDAGYDLGASLSWYDRFVVEYVWWNVLFPEATRITTGSTHFDQAWPVIYDDFVYVIARTAKKKKKKATAKNNSITYFLAICDLRNEYYSWDEVYLDHLPDVKIHGVCHLDKGRYFLFVGDRDGRFGIVSHVEETKYTEVRNETFPMLNGKVTSAVFHSETRRAVFTIGKEVWVMDVDTFKWERVIATQGSEPCAICLCPGTAATCDQCKLLMCLTCSGNHEHHGRVRENLSPLLEEPMAVVHDDEVWYFEYHAGFSSYYGDKLPDVWILNPTTLKWRYHTMPVPTGVTRDDKQLPSGHFSPAVYLGDGKTLFFGGSVFNPYGSVSSDTLYVFDDKINTWLQLQFGNGSWPTAREKHVLAYDEDSGKLIISGGYCEYVVDESQKYYNFDYATTRLGDTWLINLPAVH